MAESTSGIAGRTKGPDAFRTISEVAEDLDLPQHVLRFWETRFAQIRPMKRGGGRRYYRPEDVDLLRGIRLLLYGEGFTIRGVQRLLKEKGAAFVVAAGQTGAVQTVTPASPQPARQGATRAAAEIRSMVDGAAPEGTPEAWSDDSEEADPLVAPSPPLELDTDARRLLEAALADLLEAKRMLDQGR